MSSRDLDGFEKIRHKLKTVFGDVEKLLILGSLIRRMLS